MPPMKKRLLQLLLMIAILILIVAAWYLASPLIINKTVEEDLPFTIPDPRQGAEMSLEELDQIEEEMDQLQKEVLAAAANMPDREMNDPMPTTPRELQPAVLAQGQFHGADAIHKGSGTAIIYKLADESRLLRLQEFRVTNGPALDALLVAHPNPKDWHDIKDDYLDLGELKGNVGNQNYGIPFDVDITRYKSAVIFCVAFRVVFSTATLN